jgi:hypothetical protein
MMQMRNLLRDAVIAFAIGGVFGAGVAVAAIAYGSDDPTQKIIRKCRAAGDTVLVSKCRVMCLTAARGAGVGRVEYARRPFS